jgi:hypothetical protein
MSESSHEFLAKIGPRQLTDEEARQLHLLRIREGKASSIIGVIEKLAAEAERAPQHQAEAKATERPSL